MHTTKCGVLLPLSYPEIRTSNLEKFTNLEWQNFGETYNCT
jgi:hypothetical protein